MQAGMIIVENGCNGSHRSFPFPKIEHAVSNLHGWHTAKALALRKNFRNDAAIP